MVLRRSGGIASNLQRVFPLSCHPQPPTAQPGLPTPPFLPTATISCHSYPLLSSSGHPIVNLCSHLPSPAHLSLHLLILVTCVHSCHPFLTPLPCVPSCYSLPLDDTCLSSSLLFCILFSSLTTPLLIPQPVHSASSLFSPFSAFTSSLPDPAPSYLSS